MILFGFDKKEKPHPTHECQLDIRIKIGLLLLHIPCDATLILSEE